MVSTIEKKHVQSLAVAAPMMVSKAAEKALPIAVPGGTLTPSSNSTLTPHFPVSMVVTGGTGIHHGDTTNLTVNQYVHLTPGQGTAKEMLMDVLQATLDTNRRLFNRSKDNRSPGKASGVPAGIRKGCVALVMAVTLLSVIPLVTITLYSDLPAVEVTTIPGDILLENTTAAEEGVSADPSRHSNNVIEQKFYWQGREPSRTLTPLQLPVTRVILCQSMTEECSTPGACRGITKILQREDMESKNLPDIRYNFVVSGESIIFQGRGWDAQGDHTDNYNADSLGIAIIGTFNNQPPNDKQLEAFKEVIRLGVKYDKIFPDYALVAHCQLISDVVEEFPFVLTMTSWPHFDNSFSLNSCVASNTTTVSP